MNSEQAVKNMCKIKMCGLTREEDIEAVNDIKPEFIGFVFAKKSKRYVTPERASELKKLLDPSIRAVGVFVDPSLQEVYALVSSRTIDMVQLHGNETEDFVQEVRDKCKCPVIRAFKVRSEEDVRTAEKSCADHILLDSGAGTGTVFDWKLLKNISRPCFLAGGLDPENVSEAANTLHPYCLDVSSGIESNGFKDKNKMEAFAKAVRKEKK